MSLNIRRCVLIALFGIAGMVFSTTASAAVLLPGTSAPLGPADDITGDPLGVFLDALTTPFVAGTISGTARTEVYRRADGMLDFYYQVTNSGSSAEAIGRITGTSFLGFTTEALFRTDVFGSFLLGDIVPVEADREISGNVVGFDFPACIAIGCTNPPFGKIQPGQTSAILLIRTNAVFYEPGFMAVINGTAADAPAFQPSPIPEPTTMAFLGLGLVALGLGRRGGILR